jgi:hypothetical protein
MTDDTWFSRDLPVLDAVVRLRDEIDRSLVLTGAHIVEGTGFSDDDVIGALIRLSPTYIDVTVGLDSPNGWNIMRIHPTARTAVGQWPSAETMLETVLTGLREAADSEPDPEQRSKLKSTVAWMDGAGKDIVIGVMAAIAAKGMGIG